MLSLSIRSPDCNRWFWAVDQRVGETEVWNAKYSFLESLSTKSYIKAWIVTHFRYQNQAKFYLLLIEWLDGNSIILGSEASDSTLISMCLEQFVKQTIPSNTKMIFLDSCWGLAGCLWLFGLPLPFSGNVSPKSVLLLLSTLSDADTTETGQQLLELPRNGRAIWPSS